MVGFGILMVVVGVIVFVLAHTGVLRSDGNVPFRVIALEVATVGVIFVLSSLYLNHTPWFYWLAFAKGAVLVSLSVYLDSKKLLWPGLGLLAAGFLMVIVKPGWFLVLLLIGLAVLAYYAYYNDPRVKTAVDTLTAKVAK